MAAAAVNAVPVGARTSSIPVPSGSPTRRTSTSSFSVRTVSATSTTTLTAASRTTTSTSTSTAPPPSLIPVPTKRTPRKSITESLARKISKPFRRVSSTIIKPSSSSSHLSLVVTEEGDLSVGSKDNKKKKDEGEHAVPAIQTAMETITTTTTSMPPGLGHPKTLPAKNSRTKSTSSLLANGILSSSSMMATPVVGNLSSAYTRGSLIASPGSGAGTTAPHLPSSLSPKRDQRSVSQPMPSASESSITLPQLPEEAAAAATALATASPLSPRVRPRVISASTSSDDGSSSSYTNSPTTSSSTSTTATTSSMHRMSPFSAARPEPITLNLDRIHVRNRTMSSGSSASVASNSSAMSMKKTLKTRLSALHLPALPSFGRKDKDKKGKEGKDKKENNKAHVRHAEWRGAMSPVEEVPTPTALAELPIAIISPPAPEPTSVKEEAASEATTLADIVEAESEPELHRVVDEVDRSRDLALSPVPPLAALPLAGPPSPTAEPISDKSLFLEEFGTATSAVSQHEVDAVIPNQPSPALLPTSTFGEQLDIDEPEPEEEILSPELVPLPEASEEEFKELSMTSIAAVDGVVNAESLAYDAKAEAEVEIESRKLAPLPEVDAAGHHDEGEKVGDGGSNTGRGIDVTSDHDNKTVGSSAMLTVISTVEESTSATSAINSGDNEDRDEDEEEEEEYEGILSMPVIAAVGLPGSLQVSQEKHSEIVVDPTPTTSSTAPSDSSLARDLHTPSALNAPAGRAHSIHPGGTVSSEIASSALSYANGAAQTELGALANAGKPVGIIARPKESVHTKEERGSHADKQMQTDASPASSPSSSSSSLPLTTSTAVELALTSPPLPSTTPAFSYSSVSISTSIMATPPHEDVVSSTIYVEPPAPNPFLIDDEDEESSSDPETNTNDGNASSDSEAHENVEVDLRGDSVSGDDEPTVATPTATRSQSQISVTLTHDGVIHEQAVDDEKELVVTVEDDRDETGDSDDEELSLPISLPGLVVPAMFLPVPNVRNHSQFTNHLTWWYSRHDHATPPHLSTSHLQFSSDSKRLASYSSYPLLSALYPSLRSSRSSSRASSREASPLKPTINLPASESPAPSSSSGLHPRSHSFSHSSSHARTGMLSWLPDPVSFLDVPAAVSSRVRSASDSWGSGVGGYVHGATGASQQMLETPISTNFSALVFPPC